MKIYLASASPRRRDLLEQLHIKFEVVTSTYEEHNEEFESPYELVEAQALGKALGKALGALVPETGCQQDYVVIGSDTIVAHKGHVLGKPANEKEAVQMLRELSDDTHEVVTGVALCYYDGDKQLIKQEVFHVVTKVLFYSLSDAEINAYVATGEPLDKAGAYGIQGQGAYLVERIEGSYTNVVGLPVEVVARYLRRMGAPD